MTEIIENQDKNVSIEKDYISDVKTIKTNMLHCAKSFFAIGEKLNKIKESSSFKVGGYKNFVSFCKAELGISKNHAYNFIKIYLTFNSEDYSKFSYSQLSEMLSLPKDKLKLINENSTVKDIREIKKDVKNNPDVGKDDVLKFGQGNSSENNDVKLSRKDLEDEVKKLNDEKLNISGVYNKLLSEFQRLEEDYNILLKENEKVKIDNKKLKAEIKALKAKLKVNEKTPS